MPFGPYDYTEYNPNANGGSVYFPGGGAATFTPTNAGFGFGTAAIIQLKVGLILPIMEPFGAVMVQLYYLLPIS